MRRAGQIICRTSLRVDLAGGTLDLHPIYLFHLPCFTVNIAIGLDAVVRYEAGENERNWCFRNLQLGKEVEWQIGEGYKEVDRAGAGLVARTISHLGLNQGGTIETTLEAPPGAGLGGSSALTTGIVTLALKLTHENRGIRPRKVIAAAQAIETLVIGMPAGFQDYIAAVYGGGNLVEFGINGWKRIPIGERFARKLASHLLVVYTGKPHFSGMNNWALYRSFFDGDKRTRRFFERLAHNSREMAEAVRNKNLQSVAEWMGQDWEDRKRMLPEMTTPEIEKMIASVKREGAVAARVCGAGGGGAIAFLVPPDRRDACIQSAISEGGIVLETNSVGTGLRIAFESPDSIADRRK